MNDNKSINQKGFTLIEALVAMLILSLSLLLLLNMGIVALEGNDWSNKTTVATQAMMEKLESLRTDGDSMESGVDTVGPMVRTWTVSDAGDFLKQVDITVVWNDIRSNTRREALTTYIRTDSL